MSFKQTCTSWWINNYINKPRLSVVNEYRHQKTNSDNTKAFVHILLNFFSCVLTQLPWKFKSKILAETR